MNDRETSNFDDHPLCARCRNARVNLASADECECGAVLCSVCASFECVRCETESATSGIIKRARQLWQSAGGSG
jgi:hypothetical protein